jgi:hypothetical protein
VSRFAFDRRAALALVLGATAAAAACDLGTVTVPKTIPKIVVHAVLNASAPTQVVFVERTLTGTITVPDTTFNPNDPIVSAGGIPVTGATVEITDSAGTVLRAVEDKIVLANGQGAGVYRVSLSGAGIRLGERYRLHVQTAEGDDLTAVTRVPRPEVTSSGGLTRTFNRDHDTLLVKWKAAAATRAYALRVESPFGPFFLFTDSLQFRLTGDARNLFAGSLQRVFIPGFRQDVLVAAVDSNFFDYYRTNNDPFTGTGIISRINGGLGLFGSIVLLSSGTLTVTADQTEPIEGRYRVTSPVIDPTAPVSITLYVESPAPKSGIPAALSGRYVTGGPTGRADGIVGKLNGTSVSFALLANQLAGDTVDVFTGTFDGTTITGKYEKRVGAVVLTKQ